MCKQTIKITERDNFVWKVLTLDEAKRTFKCGIFAVYALYDDDSEELITDTSELLELDSKGVQFGIEVGFADYKQRELLEEAIKNHDFTYEYSEDMTRFSNGRRSLDILYNLSKGVSKDFYIDTWNRYAPKGLKFNI